MSLPACLEQLGMAKRLKHGKAAARLAHRCLLHDLFAGQA
jgi:hypothetical protein